MPRKKVVEQIVPEVETVETEIVAKNESMKIVEVKKSARSKNKKESEVQKPETSHVDEKASDEGNAENEFEMSKLKILRVNPDEEPDIDEESFTWREIQNANRTGKILPVIISGVEKTQSLGEIVVCYYKDHRIVVPVSEMMIELLSEDSEYFGASIGERMNRICSSMLGCEIDVIIKGVVKETQSAVASRKDAMMRKRQKFYQRPLEDGLPHVRVGRIVEGRIIAITLTSARIEVFGVEVTVRTTELSSEWMSDIKDKFSVGDKIPVVITKVSGDSIENLSISVDARMVGKARDDLSKCMLQGRYLGEVTHVHNGVAFVRLQIGINAIAHTNYDKRYPGRGDVVSFIVTRKNEDYGNVSGIISRIIKQNL